MNSVEDRVHLVRSNLVKLVKCTIVDSEFIASLSSKELITAHDCTLLVSYLFQLFAVFEILKLIFHNLGSVEKC